jgi:hypothetical protein
MKAIKLFAIMLSLFSLNAIAQSPEGLNKDWVPAAADSELSRIYYVNSKTVERNGQIAKAWTAVTRSKDKDSVKSLMEFNCKTNQARRLSNVFYKSINFSEINFSTNEPGPWGYLVPDSIDYALRDFVCKTK